MKPWLLTLLIIGTLAGVILIFFEPRMEPATGSISREARENSGLALYRTLEAAGFSVSFAEDDIDIADIPSLKICNDVSMRRKNYRVELDLEAVNQGMTLVVFFGSYNPPSNAQMLLESFKIFPTLADPKDRGLELDSQVIGPQEFSAKVRWQTDTVFHSAYPRKPRSLDNLDGQARWLQFKYGKGSVVFCADPGIWGNERIGEADHASLLTLVTAKAEEGSKAIINFRKYSYAEPLWPRAVTSLLPPLIIVVIFIVWSAILRREPSRTILSTERRNLLERCESDGWFWWKHGFQTELSERLIESFKRQAIVQLHLHEPGDLAEKLASLGGEKIATWMAILSTDPAHQTNKPDFIKLVRILETTRRTW